MQIWLDLGNTAQADMAGLGLWGYMPLDMLQLISIYTSAFGRIQNYVTEKYVSSFKQTNPVVDVIPRFREVF